MQRSFLDRFIRAHVIEEMFSNSTSVARLRGLSLPKVRMVQKRSTVVYALSDDRNGLLTLR